MIAVTSMCIGASELTFWLVTYFANDDGDVDDGRLPVTLCSVC